MNRLRRFAMIVSAGTMLWSCGTELGAPTTLTVSVHTPPEFGVDELLISARDATGIPAFAPFKVERSDGSFDPGRERIAILIPEELDGQTLVLRVDGTSRGVLRGSAGQLVHIEESRAMAASVVLAEPAVCGDGVLRAPLERCDDHNSATGDGCDSDCLVESAFSCISDAGRSPSVCTRGPTP
jgi:cysteine-rich repeat protein